MGKNGHLAKEKMKTTLDKALAKMRDRYNCTQSVLYACCEDLNLDPNTALRVGCGLGAGMGRNGEVCGAVTGGILVLGLKHGRGEHDDRSATEVTYAKTRQLMDEFKRQHGTFICRELLKGCDLSTSEGQHFFNDNDLGRRVCWPCVESVIKILHEMI